jgi:hypothetical protein
VGSQSAGAGSRLMNELTTTAASWHMAVLIYLGILTLPTSEHCNSTDEAGKVDNQNDREVSMQWVPTSW